MLQSIFVDKNIPIPLYYQLKKQIIALIENGSLKTGDPLPAENELCQMLGVSRPTIRQAFSGLVQEGYLDRYKGRGTFVSKPKVDDRFFSKLESFSEEMAAKGFKPQTKVLKLEKLHPPHEANEKLQLGLETPLIYLSRLRFADGMPLVYVETFLSYHHYQELMHVDFTEQSLYHSLETIYHVRISRAHREIMAINANKKEAELLNIAGNNALSLVKTTAYAGETPVEFSIARYSGELNKFTVDVYR